MSLNERAQRLCGRIVEQADTLRIEASQVECGTRLIDCGVTARGGLEAGRLMVEVCLAGLGRVDLTAGDATLWPGPTVTVRTDAPLAACMASQYAGWQVAGDDFFAMGSGPMRAAAGREELFDDIGHRERPEMAVGVLETSQRPPDAVCRKLASDCAVEPERLTLLLARTASQAGAVQVVARSIETALHKMYALKFDLGRVESGFGTAPLPPVAGDDLAAIGRTNDAVLYGGRVTLWVRGDDDSLAALAPEVPSCSSADYGEPFADIFERYDRDFYKIDPLLFSPAEVTLFNVDTGNTFRSGQLLPDVIVRSFGG